MKLSIGEVHIAPPGLRGWKAILQALSEEQYRKLLDVAMSARQSAGAGEASPDALRGVVGQFAPLLGVLPDVAAAFAQAVVRQDGKRLTSDQAWELTEVDLDEIVQAVLQADWALEVLRRLKKYLRGETASLPSGPA